MNKLQFLTVICYSTRKFFLSLLCIPVTAPASAVAHLLTTEIQLTHQSLVHQPEIETDVTNFS